MAKKKSPKTVAKQAPQKVTKINSKKETTSSKWPWIIIGIVVVMTVIVFVHHLN